MEKDFYKYFVNLKRNIRSTELIAANKMQNYLHKKSKTLSYDSSLKYDFENHKKSKTDSSKYDFEKRV